MSNILKMHLMHVHRALASTPPRQLLSSCLGLLVGMCGMTVHAAPLNNYPTTDRVRFILECMRDHPGAHYEMMSKCACVIDRIADTTTYDEYTNLRTETDAASIGGERGGVMRDNAAVQKDVRAFKAQVAKTKQSCMIGLPP